MTVSGHHAGEMRTDEKGFTLIEILVVVTIIGILISIAVMSFGLIGDDRGIQKQVRQLSSIVEIVSEEAQMQGRDFGLEVIQKGYRFVEHDPYIDEWNEVVGDDLLQTSDLGEDLEFELFLEDRRVLLQAEVRRTKLDEDAPDRDLTEDYLPHIFIMSSGDITPFRLDLVRITDDSRVALELKAGGEFEVITDESEL